jgi:hypothetical protein
MTALALLFSPRGEVSAGCWLIAWALQTVLSWALTRHALAPLDVATPQPALLLGLALSAILVLWSISATTLKRLTGKRLSRWHFAWILALWIVTTVAGGHPQLGPLLITLNLLLVAWLAWPRRWRWHVQERA